MFTTGDVVELKGLLARPELNTRRGSVLGPANAQGRYPVRLLLPNNTCTEILLKPECLDTINEAAVLGVLNAIEAKAPQFDAADEAVVIDALFHFLHSVAVQTLAYDVLNQIGGEPPAPDPEDRTLWKRFGEWRRLPKTLGGVYGRGSLTHVDQMGAICVMGHGPNVDYNRDVEAGPPVRSLAKYGMMNVKTDEYQPGHGDELEGELARYRVAIEEACHMLCTLRMTGRGGQLGRCHYLYESIAPEKKDQYLWILFGNERPIGGDTRTKLFSRLPFGGAGRTSDATLPSEFIFEGHAQTVDADLTFSKRFKKLALGEYYAERGETWITPHGAELDAEQEAIMLDVMYIFRQAPAGYEPQPGRHNRVSQVPLGVGMCSYCAAPTKKKETDYAGVAPWPPIVEQVAARYYCCYSCLKRDAPWRAEEKARLVSEYGGAPSSSPPSSSPPPPPPTAPPSTAVAMATTEAEEAAALSEERSDLAKKIPSLRVGLALLLLAAVAQLSMQLLATTTPVS